MSDCRFGVSPVNYPDPDPDPIFFNFNTNSRFPPFLLYVRCKSGVTFIRRSFRDDE